MTTDALFTPPRKKRSILWWLAGVIFLLACLFFFQLFGPNAPIIVSRETTYITEPLGPDGLPDYEAYVLERRSAGVTPENNAAVLLWQALFPGELEEKDYAAVATALGIERIPSEEDALVPAYNNDHLKKLTDLLRERYKSQLAADAAATSGNGAAIDPMQSPVESGPVETLADTLLSELTSRPWTSEQIPFMAEWVAANEQPLDLIVEASQRPRYFMPSPTLVNRQRDMLVAMMMPHIQSSREAARSLPTRAMWHLGEGRPMEAWQDILAVHRVGRLISQGNSLVEDLVAIAIGGIACDNTVTLLDHGKLTPEQSREVMRDLAVLPAFKGIGRSLDEGERLWAIDAFMRTGTTGGAELFSELGAGGDESAGHALSIVSLDWNIVLRETNAWYDRMAAAANNPDHEERMAALSRLDSEIQQHVEATRSPGSLFASAISRRQRSKLVSGMMLALFTPALNAATAAEDRSNTTLELTRLAAALAVFRAEDGAYPEKLDELVPDVLEKLPVDFNNGKPFRYQRDTAGYLLYSIGANARDDGGSNEMMRLLNGRDLNELDAAEVEKLEPTIPAGADDWIIRVPRPAFEFPKSVPGANQP
jgi:hypothetical protein